MFAVTGDIHDMTLRTRDQARLPTGETEVRISRKYLQVMRRYNINATLYVTGAVAALEQDELLQITRDFEFELGGHTYSCYRPRLAYGLSRRLLRLANGPKVLQRADMMRTIAALSKVSGQSIMTWRNHAYRTDRNTVGLAAECGMLGISSDVALGRAPWNAVTSSGSIVNLPINTPPDHENLHPIEGIISATFPDADSWVDAVIKQVEANEAKKVPSIILAHPACMEIVDGMKALERLVKYLSVLESVTMSEVARFVTRGSNSSSHLRY